MNKTITPLVEEYLQAMYAMEVEKASDAPRDVKPETIEEALGERFIERHGTDIRLTPHGLELGRDVMRRHRLAECLLRDILIARPDSINEGACEFEHILQRGLDERVCVLLGHPRTCPHGKAIPEGECCRKARADQIREVCALCDGKPGDEGTVAYLSTRDNREVQKMMAMGILPGANIRLIQRFPSYVFQVGHSQFAVDRPLAEVIYVHWAHRA